MTAHGPLIHAGIVLNIPRHITSAALCAVIAVSIALAANHARAATRSAHGTPIDNPFCKIPTYAASDYYGQAKAIITPDKSPAIIINPRIMNRAPLTRFLMAHECCHHKLGHMDKLNSPVPKRKWRSILYRNEKFELDADCCAARLLSKRNDTSSLEDAQTFMSSYGHSQTGFGYPRGSERAQTIARCSQPGADTPKNIITENR